MWDFIAANFMKLYIMCVSTANGRPLVTATSSLISSNQQHLDHRGLILGLSETYG